MHQNLRPAALVGAAEIVNTMQRGLNSERNALLHLHLSRAMVLHGNERRQVFECRSDSIAPPMRLLKPNQEGLILRLRGRSPNSRPPARGKGQFPPKRLDLLRLFLI
jgi:hypothetical protein